nr:MAG TPA: coat protein [Caudoviricetes sp.]
MHPSYLHVNPIMRELHHTNKCPNIGRPIVLTKGLPINIPYRRPTIDALHCQTKSCDT